MNAETFCEHFATFADAPNGVKKLRELIFDLAANGRILSGITAEVIESESRLLGDVAEFVMGQAPPGNECNKSGIGTVFVKTGEFGLLYPDTVEWTTKPLKFARRGDVLICVVGATVGKLNLAIDCAIGRSVAAIRPADGLGTRFLYYMLMPFVLKLRQASRGSAQGVIGKEDLSKVQIWVPSEGLQRRIVEKVDELLGLCDELAARQAAQREKRQRLVGATLDRLVSTRDPAEFPTHAHRLRNHFDQLFDTPTTIPQLRQTILQLAVQGQLVPQDPNDEPANVALADIERERISRNEAGEIPSQRPVSAIKAGDELFELPQGWQWARFGHLCLFIEAGWSPKCEERPRIGDEWGVIKISAVTWGHFDADENKTLPSHMEPRLNCEILSGDFLMSRANTAELVARSVVVNDVPPRLLLNDKVLRVRFPDAVDKHYVNLFNNGGFARQYYVTVASGTSESMRNVSRESILEMPIPVPPLAEQKRIVTKVTELLSLCDALEAKLTQAESASTQLLSAAVHHLLNSTT
jgi:type I restriction enzyme S subunit